MNALVALAIAGGALVAIETRGGSRPFVIVEPWIPTLDDLLGRPKTLGDGKLTEDEISYCKAQSELADQLKALGLLEASKLCGKTNPADIRCRALRELETCKRDLGTGVIDSIVSTKAVVGAVSSVTNAVGDAIGGAIAGIFGDFAWLLLAGGITYLVLVHK